MKHVRDVAIIPVVLLLGTVAAAQEFVEDFESYAAGTKMHGKGGWKGWDNEPAAGAPVSGEYAFTGSHSVEIIDTADLVHEFDIAGGRWQVTAMQFIPSGTAGTTFFILLNSYTDGGDAKDWSVQTQFDLSSGFVSYWHGGRTQVIYDQWVELKHIIDLGKNTVDKYYNGEFIVTDQWDDDNHATFQCIDLFGNGASSVYYDDIAVSRYFIHKAHEPDPADGAPGVSSPLLQWAAGDTAAFHNVYFGTSPQLTEADLVSDHQAATTYSHPGELEPGATYYWRVDEIAADEAMTYTGDVWSFTAFPLTAYAASPADEAALSSQALRPNWQPGRGAAEHHVYFGDSYDAVAAADSETDKGSSTETAFSTGLLRAGTTYYWRVDTIDGDGKLHVGEVWSFTTGQPVDGKIVREWWLGVAGFGLSGLTNDPRYPNDSDGRELVELFEGPIDWDDHYGSRLYGWLKPIESGDYTFWIASNDHSELWLSTDADPAKVRRIAHVPDETAPRQWAKYPDAQQSYPLPLKAGQKYYIEAIMREYRRDDNIAVAWQPPGGRQQVIPAGYVDTYALAPVKAATPLPSHGATETAQSLILGWRAGENAVEHDVYLGDNAQVVRDADTASVDVYRGRQATAGASSGALEWDKTYYWRVDEVQPDGAILKGTVWRFTTADYIPVDTFESYTNEFGERVFEVWIDGVGFDAEFWEKGSDPGNGTGAVVGHDIWDSHSQHYGGTIMETAHVAQSDQAMPLNYDNAAMPYYSEAERTWAVPQDWTANGVDTLSLWIRGKTGNAAEAVYVIISDAAGNVATISKPDPTATKNPNWTQWAVALSAAADVGVDLSTVVGMAIGIGDRNAPRPGGAGTLLVDDIRVTKAGAGE